MQAAREDAWQRAWDHTHPAGAPPGPDHPEHQRHTERLRAARDAEAHAHATAQSRSGQVHELSTALERAPFYARARRRELTTRLATGRQQLHAAITTWQAATTRVGQLTELVDADRAQRATDTATARQHAHAAWTARPDTPYLDADTLTYPVGTWTQRPRPTHDPLEHDPELPGVTATRPEPAHVIAL